MEDKREITPDGYLVIKDTAPQPIIRGVQCGQCGMKFEYNQGYGFSCQHSNCPMNYKVTS